MLKYLSTKTGEREGSRALSMMLEGVSGQLHTPVTLSGEDTVIRHEAERFHSQSGHSSKGKSLSHCPESTLTQPVS
jgi:hypothetical protein